MICQRCLRQAFNARSFPSLRRTLASTAGPTTASPRPDDHPAATSTSAPQPFSTPLSPSADEASLDAGSKPKSKSNVPKSKVAAGTTLKGLNYFKGKEDPLALPDEDYPEWLWRCLDSTKKGSGGDAAVGDEFCKLFPPYGYSFLIIVC